MASPIEKAFKRAVDFIQNTPKGGSYEASNSEKLELYGLFKQATEGKCNAKKPSRLNLVAKAKWDAWNDLGNMPKEEAMKKYIQKVVEISKKIVTKQSDEFRNEMLSALNSKL